MYDTDDSLFETCWMKKKNKEKLEKEQHNENCAFWTSLSVKFPMESAYTFLH